MKLFLSNRWYAACVKRRNPIFETLALVCLLGTIGSASAQELETESARLLPEGGIKGGVGFEFQTSSDGKEYAVPFFLEYGLLNRLELTVEPVMLTSIQPNSGTSATGGGDLEMTVTGLALEEKSWFPAMALAGEIKVPTAQNTQIGTKEFDYAGFLILSKRLGDFDAHFNFGYTVIGQPPGVQVNNTFNFAQAVKYYPNNKWDFFFEALENTSASSQAETPVPGGTEAGSGTTTELTGAEIVGTIGVGYKVIPSLLLSLGISYDNNSAVLIHPGLTFNFKLF